MIFFPNCKINIGLSIVAKRPDAYHDIESVFYPVPLCDALEIRPSKNGETHFTLSGLEIGECETENNLCMKALRLLQRDYPQIGGVNVHLDKAVPAFAGLGGGSADAAYTLRLTDMLFSLGLSEEDLQHYAGMLGSDCFFFLQDKPMFVHGRGEKMERTELSLAGKYIVLIKPDIKISTSEAYKGVSPKPSQINYREMPPLNEWKEKVKNDFEDSLLPKYPVLAEIKQVLYENGALYASLSGSGATVYGIFEKECDLQRIKRPNNAFLWQGVLR